MKRKKNRHAQADNQIASILRKHGKIRGSRIATQYIKDGLLGDTSIAASHLEKAIDAHRHTM